MNLAVGVTPDNSLEDLGLDGEKYKPLVVLRPLPDQAWTDSKVGNGYLVWLLHQLSQIEKLGLYTIVGAPITLFQGIPLTDAELTRVLGDAYPQRVFAIYFMQGGCPRSDYWLRLYGAIRLGLRAKWITEPLHDYPDLDRGDMRDMVCQGAMGCYVRKGERLQPGVDFAVREMSEGRFTSYSTAAIYYTRSKGILVLSVKAWKDGIKLWRLLLRSKS